MSLPAIQTLRASTPELQRVQDNVVNALRPVLRTALMGGVLVKGVVLTSGNVTLVKHGLPQAAQGWIVCDTTAAARVWRVSATAPATVLPLTADAATTITLWVF